MHQSLLAFAEEAVERRGGDVHRIWWTPPTERQLEQLPAWVCDQVARTLDELGDAAEEVLIGKSLGTLAAPVAADRRLTAVRLTPVSEEDVFVRGYENASAPRLLVGGTADPMWNGAVARRLPLVITRPLPFMINSAKWSLEQPLSAVDQGAGGVGVADATHRGM